MAAPRVENTPQDQKLKQAAGALIAAVGGVEKADGFCRPNFRRLSEYQRPDNDCFMPIDAVADLEGVARGTAGYPQVTRVLCQRAGGVFVPLPSPGPVSASDLHAGVARHSRKAAAVTSELVDDLADGRIDPEEAERGQARIMEAVEELMALHAMLDRIVEEG
jgi:hypothetical protein